MIRSRPQLLRLVAAALARPGAWPGAVVSVRRTARRGWWHRPPLLPVPDHRWWGVRMEVAYGRCDATASGRQVRDVLRWTWRMRRWSRR